MNRQIHQAGSDEAIWISDGDLRMLCENEFWMIQKVLHATII